MASEGHVEQLQVESELLITLKNVLDLIKWGKQSKGFSHVASRLKTPVSDGKLSNFINPDSRKLLSDIRKELEPIPDISFLFERFLLASVLLSLDGTEDPVSLLSILDINTDRLLSGVFPNDPGINLKHFRFATVPVPMTIPHKNTEVVNFIIGAGDRQTLQPYPQWAERVMDKSARDAVIKACIAVGRGCRKTVGQFCFPLVTPLEKGAAIKGGSLGLPIAIGLEALARNTKINVEIIATGRITENGNVESVSIDGKTNFAEKRYSVLLCPRSSVTRITDTTGIKVFPVDSLADAMRVLDLWVSGGNISRMHKLLSIEKGDADDFIAHLGTIDASSLKYLIARGLVSKFIDQILSDKKRVEKFARQFYSAIISSEKSIEDKEVVSELIQEDNFSRINSISITAALHVSSAKAQILNHRGRTIEAKKWKKKGFMIADEALNRNVDAYVNFINHALITDTDGFDFNPDIPHHAEKLAKDIDKYYPRGIINETPGKFCGTLSQHYAFCGPSYFEKFMKYHKSACEYFGLNIAPEEHEREWRRQYNYLAYAAMDKGDYALAESAIITYIGFDEDKDLMDVFESDFPGREVGSGFDDYLHACLCRFIAETGNARLAEKYMNHFAPAHAEKNTHNHPYQLWFFNLGRISLALGDKESAEKKFKKSLEICMLAKQGETIRIMGLLPLSYLYAHKWWSNEFAQDYARIRHTALAVNKDFFSILAREPMKDILFRVYKSPEKFFPFTFR